MLKWIFDRCAGTAHATDTVLGPMPTAKDLDLSGLDIPAADVAELLSIDKEGWLSKIPALREHLVKLGDRVPKALHEELNALEQRLKKA